MSKKVVLITGASSGIGYYCARLFCEGGYTVYCASRRGKGPGGHALIMDVTDEASVKEGVNTIIREQGRIDILIHCAGNGYCGPLECSTKEDMRLQMEVNLFAAQSLVNAVLPAMRVRRSGALLFVGSVGGDFAIPYQTLYSCSKAALAIYVEGLRLELKPFNVRAAVIEPGDVKTDFTNSRAPIKAECPDCYKDHMRRAVSRMEGDEQNGMSPLKVAKVIFKISQKKNPRARTVVGADYRLLVFVKRLIPYRLAEWALYKMYIG